MEDIQPINPQLIIGGKTVTTASPKMKVWREFLAFFDQDKGQMCLFPRRQRLFG